MISRGNGKGKQVVLVVLVLVAGKVNERERTGGEMNLTVKGRKVAARKRKSRPTVFLHRQQLERFHSRGDTKTHTRRDFIFTFMEHLASQHRSNVFRVLHKLNCPPLPPFVDSPHVFSGNQRGELDKRA